MDTDQGRIGGLVGGSVDLSLVDKPSYVDLVTASWEQESRAPVVPLI